MSSKAPEENKLGHENQRSNFKLAQDFIPVLITSNFENESTKMNAPAWKHNILIKMKLLSSAQHFSCLWDTRGRVTITPVVQIVL